MDKLNPADANFLTLFLEQFLLIIKTGTDALKPYVWQLIGILAIIDLASTWTLYSGEIRLSQMISRVIKVSAFCFLLFNYVDIIKMISTSLKAAGLIAAGVNPETFTGFTPSHIIGKGLEISSQLFKSSSIGSNFFLSCLGIILTLFTYFLIGFQLILSVLEFNIFVCLGMVLIPFGLLQYTSFLWQSVMQNVFRYGIKLMITYFILGVATSFINKAVSLNVTDFSTMMSQVIGMASIALLVWQIPALANGMIFGSGGLGSDASGRAVIVTGRMAGNAAKKLGNSIKKLAAASMG